MTTAETTARDKSSGGSGGMAVWGRRLPYLLLGLISLGMLAGALGVAPVRVAHPYPLTPVEPQPVFGALRVARGEALYHDFLAERPVVPLSYGILTYVVPGTIGRVFGMEDPALMLSLGRLVSLASALGVVGLLVLLARQRGVSWRLALVAGLPLFWMPVIAAWFSQFTPDAPALFFSLAGWTALGPPRNADDAEKRAAVARGVAAVALWTVAFHFKPTILVGQVAFGVERLSRQGRGAIFSIARLAVGNIAAALVTSFVLNLATDGLWKLHLIGSQFSMSPLFLLDNLSRFRLPFLGAGVMGVLLLWAAIYARRQPLFVAFLVVFAVDCLASLKQGSDLNYFLESLAIWGLAATMQIAATMQPATSMAHQVEAIATSCPTWRRATTWLCLAATVCLGFAFPWSRMPTFNILPEEREYLYMDAMMDYNPDASILCLDPWFGMTRGYPFPFIDGYHAALLERLGMVDFSPEIESIRDGRYDFVLSNDTVVWALRQGKYHGLEMFPASLAETIVETSRPLRRGGKWLALWKVDVQERESGGNRADTDTESDSELRSEGP